MTYEIDPTEAHASALRRALRDFVEQARRNAGPRQTSSATRLGQRREPRRNQPNGDGQRANRDREQNQAIRDWAPQQGMTVSERGRIPREVTDAYQRAH